jgi:hypothetical protein
VHKNCANKRIINNKCCTKMNNINSNNSDEQIIKNNSIHAFVEKTYFNPTYCQFCGGLLVGLVVLKQGLQCKYCKYDCHKSCSKFVTRNCTHHHTQQHSQQFNYEENKSVKSVQENINNNNNNKKSKINKLGKRIGLLFNKSSNLSSKISMFRIFFCLYHY